MPQIDDPIEQIRALIEKPNVPWEVTVQAILTAFPILGRGILFIKSEQQKVYLAQLNNAVLDAIKNHNKRIEEFENILESEQFGLLIAKTMNQINSGTTETRVKRFAAVIADTIINAKSDTDIEDAAAFIRALEELSETDIKVLKHLYTDQRKLVTSNHVIDYNSFFENNRMRNMLLGATNLGIPMDSFFARCSRLTGYGLALPLERREDSVSPSEFAFRITLLGKKLIEILGTIESTEPIYTRRSDERAAQ